jgi:hypothetical protein
VKEENMTENTPPVESEATELPTKRFGQNGINNFCTCKFCFEDKPRGVSTAEYSRLHVGFTTRGIQVWCARHEVNVIHLDFEGDPIKGSSTVDPEDREALLARLPATTEAVERIEAKDVIRAGLVVMEHRLATTGLAKDTDSGRGTTYAELLKVYVTEMERYLKTGVLGPEWQAAYEMIKVQRGGGLILPPGRLS